MDGSLETIEAVRSARDGMERARRWRFSEWLGRISTRAAIVSAFMLAVVALQAWNAHDTLARQSAVVEELGVRQRTLDAAVDAFSAAVASYGTAYAGVVAGAVQPSAIAARMLAQANQLATSFRRIEDLLGTEIDPVAIGAARDMLGRLPDLVERSRQAVAGRRRTDLAPMHEEWLEALAAFNRLAEASRDVLNRRYDASLRAAEAFAREGRFVTVAAAGLGIAAAVLVWVVLIGMITRPVGVLAQSMIRVARGDLGASVPMTEREDQLGQMARAVLVFRDNLNVIRSLADQAREGARRTAAATGQASAAIGSVADGAAKQLAELQAVAAALSDNAESIRSVGRSTQETSDRAAEAKVILDESLRKVRGLMEIVGGVGEDTERVTRIAAAITGMAAQTNVLAMNAAIEAARAGEHGRGLAVLAEEVRQLAVGTEGLAREISEVVRGAGERAGEGSRTAAEVSASVDVLERLVGETARLAGAIAQSMAQQQATVRRLDERVAVLTRIGEANATAAEQITVSMVELARLAGDTRVAVETVASGAEKGRNL